jgi:hypothetical protein
MLPPRGDVQDSGKCFGAPELGLGMVFGSCSPFFGFLRFRELSKIKFAHGIHGSAASPQRLFLVYCEKRNKVILLGGIAALAVFVGTNLAPFHSCGGLGQG